MMNICKNDFKKKANPSRIRRREKRAAAAKCKKNIVAAEGTVVEDVILVENIEMCDHTTDSNLDNSESLDVDISLENSESTYIKAEVSAGCNLDEDDQLLG